MGFVLTLVYVVVAHLSPEQLMPSLAPYRPQLILALLAIVVSFINLSDAKSPLLRAPQTYLLVAFIAAALLSNLAHLWLGGVLLALSKFLPSAVVFFLVVLNVTTWRRLRWLVIVVVITALALLVQAVHAYETGDPSSVFLFQQRLFEGNTLVSVIYRIRAVGFLQDPNDFAQYLLLTLPLIWLAWRRRAIVRNLIFVVVPCAFIMYGLYLTRSRGALLGIVTLTLLALRSRLGTVASGVLAGVLLLALLATSFSGGRAISMEQGYGRLDAWSDGLQMVKHSPIVGVGFGEFTEYHRQTAHNSFLLCAAELGLVGFLPWMALLLISMHSLDTLSSISTEFEGQTTPKPMLGLNGSPAERTAAVPSTTLHRWAKAIKLALATFLVTGWFLSRTYSMTLYLLLGMALALTRFAGPKLDIALRPPKNWGWRTVLLAIGVVVVLYVTVRLRPA